MTHLSAYPLSIALPLQKTISTRCNKRTKFENASLISRDVNCINCIHDYAYMINSAMKLSVPGVKVLAKG